MLFPLLYGFGLIGMSWWSERQAPTGTERAIAGLLKQPEPQPTPPGHVSYIPSVLHPSAPSGWQVLQNYPEFKKHIRHVFSQYDIRLIHYLGRDIPSQIEALHRPLTSTEARNVTEFIVDISPMYHSIAWQLMRDLVSIRELLNMWKKDPRMLRIAGVGWSGPQD